MKLIKYFALALVLFAGQAMAYDNHHGSSTQIRHNAQHLINAERSLLRSVNYFGSRYSHVAADLRVLINRTIRLKSSTYRHNGRVMRARMRAVRSQFYHMSRMINRDHRLHHSRTIAARLRNVGYKVRRLSRSVYAHNGRYYRRPAYWH